MKIKLWACLGGIPMSVCLGGIYINMQEMRERDAGCERDDARETSCEARTQERPYERWRTMGLEGGVPLLLWLERGNPWKRETWERGTGDVKMRDKGYKGNDKRNIRNWCRENEKPGLYNITLVACVFCHRFFQLFQCFYSCTPTPNHLSPVSSCMPPPSILCLHI